MSWKPVVSINVFYMKIRTLGLGHDPVFSKNLIMDYLSDKKGHGKQGGFAFTWDNRWYAPTSHGQ